MGKIIKDGVTYAGSSSTAKRIKFDNTDSELDATTVQAAIEELARKIAELQKQTST